MLLLLESVYSQSGNSSQNIFGKRASPKLKPLFTCCLFIMMATGLPVSLLGSGSTCACDLLVGACDTSCCCDQDCSTTELDTFYCNTNR